MKGNAITFTFTVDVQGQQAPVTYKGTVEKNTMKGTLDIARDGQRDVYRHEEVKPAHTVAVVTKCWKAVH